MSLPTILIASPIRYRPECPEVLSAFLKALAMLEWPGEREYWFAVHDDDDGQPADDAFEAIGAGYTRLTFLAKADSRLLGGPRSTGETQENLAFLRNKILRHFQESQAELLFMVDSDVVLKPRALQELHAALACGPGPATISLQINNTPFEGGEPFPNAMVYDESDKLLGPRWRDIGWAEDGSVVEVHRSGACTLYPREILRYRFHWQPGYREEHQSLFDQARHDGWKHYLLRSPYLAEHRMKREPSIHAALEKLIGAKAATNA